MLPCFEPAAAVSVSGTVSPSPRMETSDQNPSPTVFDMPPRETESVPEATTSDWLESRQARDLAADAPAGSEPPAAPDAPAHSPTEGPWFARYVEADDAARVASGGVREEPMPPEERHDEPYSPPAQETAQTYAPIRIRPLLFEPAPQTHQQPEAEAGQQEWPPEESITQLESHQPDPASAPATITDRITPVEAPALPPRTKRRRPLLSEDADMGSGSDPGVEPASMAPISYMVSSSRPVNQRRSARTGKLVGLAFLANLLILAAFGAWNYNHFANELETRLADALASQPSRPFPSTVHPGLPAADTASPELSKLDQQLRTAQARLAEAEEQNQVHAAQLKELARAVKNSEARQVKAATAEPDPTSSPKKDTAQAALAKADEDLKAQLQAAQKRLAEAEQKNQQQAKRLDELSAAVADISAAKQALATDAAVTPTQSELVLLKERNRLTAYADEAIATGERLPYERLWEALDDPRLSTLVHAIRTEILRVQHFYLSGSRLERFVIPVATYFPESASLKDSQLSEQQLIALLSNHKNPWEVRMKAANILGGRPSKPVGDALVKAVEIDPNLDVVKEATFSFEQMTRFRGKLFEPAPLIAWWKEFNAKQEPAAPKPAPAPQEPAVKQAPAEPKAAQAKPVEAKPAAETKPADAPPAEAKPAAETKPADAKP